MFQCLVLQGKTDIEEGRAAFVQAQLIGEFEEEERERESEREREADQQGKRIQKAKSSASASEER